MGPHTAERCSEKPIAPWLPYSGDIVEQRFQFKLHERTTGPGNQHLGAFVHWMWTLAAESRLIINYGAAVAKKER